MKWSRPGERERKKLRRAKHSKAIFPLTIRLPFSGISAKKMYSFYSKNNTRSSWNIFLRDCQSKVQYQRRYLTSVGEGTKCQPSSSKRGLSGFFEESLASALIASSPDSNGDSKSFRHSSAKVLLNSHFLPSLSLWSWRDSFLFLQWTLLPQEKKTRREQTRKKEKEKKQFSFHHATERFVPGLSLFFSL